MEAVLIRCPECDLEADVDAEELDDEFCCPDCGSEVLEVTSP